ncbi:Ig-like domain-containing protein, partial [Synechococcus sp. OH2]|uniref:Ig-like domain-containing protein n=1 Tax=Synechococcus sp. OH2 TaxID=136798 RepID=UPI0039C26CB2
HVPPPPTPTPTPTPVGRVISISPSDGSTNVAITTSITIRFSEPVREAPLTQALSITSVAPQAGAVPPRDLAFNSDRTQVTVTFRTPLSNDSVYRVTISRAVPDLFASGRSLAEDFVATFTTGNVAATGGPISLLPTQLAAVTPNGQVFSSPNVVPVGYGIRRSGVAENLPVGVYTDYRAVLSFSIPDSIPANAAVQSAQLTLVQLPSNDSAQIGDFGDTGRGFFFLDPTPHNLPANNVVFQEVTLGAPNNVVSSDFFAPASTPSFIALSINGNVLGGDVSAGPRTADVQPGVQRSVSGTRFYQVRLQCAKEVWNNQAAPVFLVTTGTTSVTTTGIVTATQRFNVTATQTFVVTGAASATVSNTITGGVTTPFTQSVGATASVSGTATAGRTVADGRTESFSFTVSGTVSFTAAQFITAGLGFTSVASATVTFAATGTVVGSETRSETVTVTGSVTASATTTVTPFTRTAPNAGFEISQGANGVCRAEFDREPATGTGGSPITTARGPRLDITFSIPR